MKPPPLNTPQIRGGGAAVRALCTIFDGAGSIGNHFPYHLPSSSSLLPSFHLYSLYFFIPSTFTLSTSSFLPYFLSLLLHFFLPFPSYNTLPLLSTSLPLLYTSPTLYVLPYTLSVNFPSPPLYFPIPYLYTSLPLLSTSLPLLSNSLTLLSSSLPLLYTSLPLLYTSLPLLYTSPSFRCTLSCLSTFSYSPDLMRLFTQAATFALFCRNIGFRLRAVLYVCLALSEFIQCIGER